MKAFFDIDTQLDFMVPGGALYGPGAERLVPAIATLNRYASDRKIPLISTTDAHPENADEFRIWPPHCVIDTFGQRKPTATLLEFRQILPYDPGFELSTLGATLPAQIVVEKNDLDIFTNPHVPALLSKLNVTDCIVYGIFIDYCVKCAIMGLLNAGKQVSLVTDASASISQAAGDLVIRDFIAAGGRLISSGEAIA
jgi:nicotinamidase-related amidase